MRYTVTKAFRPGGSNSPEAMPGSELELTESQARVFKALNWVEAAKPKVAEPPRFARSTYMRRDMTAETAGSDTSESVFSVPEHKVGVEEPEPAAKKVATKRTYTRRTVE